MENKIIQVKACSCTFLPSAGLEVHMSDVSRGTRWICVVPGLAGTGRFGFRSTRAGLSQTQLSHWDIWVHSNCAPAQSWHFTGSDLKCKVVLCSPCFYIICVIVSHAIWHQRLSNVAPQPNWYKKNKKSATCCWQNSSFQNTAPLCTFTTQKSLSF